MGRRKIGEIVHPGRVCESCAICGVASDAYRHPENWNEDLRQWLVDSGQITDPKACLCRKCERTIRRKWDGFCEKETMTEAQSTLPHAKRVRRDIQCVVQELLDTSVSCSGSVVCASFEGCTVESAGACFCVSPEAVADACATTLLDKPSAHKLVIPLCKLHHNQLYRLALHPPLNSRTYVFSMQYSTVFLQVLQQCWVHYLWHCDSKSILQRHQDMPRCCTDYVLPKRKLPVWEGCHRYITSVLSMLF